MVQLFYFNCNLIFSPCKEEIYYIYASLQEGFKIEDDVEINKYIGT